MIDRPGRDAASRLAAYRLAGSATPPARETEAHPGGRGNSRLTRDPSRQPGDPREPVAR